jgi:hypothetical protein
MPATVRNLFAVAAALTLAPAPACAWVVQGKAEHFGPEKPAPLTGVLAGFDPLLNRPGRVYWQHEYFSGFGQDRNTYQTAHTGDGDTLNAALLAFAALPADVKRYVVFAPGDTGAVTALDGKRQVACRWRFHVVSVLVYKELGEYKPQAKATVTAWLVVYVPDRPAPATAATPERLAEWVAALANPRQPVREQAFRDLAAQGASARPALRRALAGSAAPEQRQRLERLLHLSDGVNLEEVTIPNGLEPWSLDGLLSRVSKPEHAALGHEVSAVLGPELNVLAASAADALKPLRLRIDEFCAKTR